ncbi:MAG: hypothetical protein RMJ60_03290 [Anaerolineales bacterium]|nr:hypothetical protein [Anaerolineales bacterium]
MQITLSITTLIFLLVICLSGGILIASIFFKAKSDSTEESASSSSESVTDFSPSRVRPEDTEVLRAWRTQEGKLWLEMNGQRLERKQDLQDRQKKALEQLLSELHFVDEPVQPTELQTAPSTSSSRAFVPPAPPSQSRPVSVVLPTTQAPSGLKSIVEQIDEVLQDRLSRSPLFAGRNIRLIEGRNGIVLVEVDHQRFEGIDAVPDVQIRALIRQAITEWEKGGD